MPLSRIVVSLVCLLCLAGCDTGDDGRDADLSVRTIRAVTTTGMIADAVTNVGGNRLKVTALMGPGVDPHLFKASAGDVTAMMEADVIFFNGLHLEGKLTEVLGQTQKQGIRTHAVTEGMDHEAYVQFEGTEDPHVWFDVTLWMRAVEKIRDVLVEMDPYHEESYEKNAAAYLQELNELNSYVKAQAGSVPAKQRVLITAHDAFHYFGRAYGFEVRGLQGISTATEAGTADVKELSDFIAEQKIPAIFVESSVPRRNIEAVQAAVQSRGFEVTIGGELFSDAMGDPGTPEGSYLGMVRHNIDTIVKGLRGEGH
ncbi:MAG: metal ABC transporter solute-binding protein, Zn/Mn family [Planctomycetota bacterium]|jgi:manganese/zinc/iron transport system substrate-binding protein